MNGTGKKLGAAFGTVLLTVSLTGCCSHEWEAATCEAPETCTECGETRGEALGHTWVDATCTTPKTCSTCGKTEGEALGHTWVDATYEAPMTCSVCGETTGERMHHVNVSDWSSDGIYYISNEYLIVYDSETKKYHVADYSGNPVDKSAFGSNEHLANTEWDRVNFYGDGNFIAYNFLDDNAEQKYETYIITPELNVVYGKYQDDWILNYMNGYLLSIFYENEDGEDYVYYICDMESNGYKLYGKSIADPCNGIYTRVFDKWKTDENGVQYNSETFTYDGNTLDKKHYTYEGNPICLQSCAVSMDGWVVAVERILVNEEENTWDSIGGCFNINTNEFIEFPDDSSAFKIYMEKDGGDCSALNGFAVLKVSTTSDDSSIFRPFNLSTGEYAGENTYLNVVLTYDTYALAENMEGQWGYLNSSDMSEAGEWYEDATDFCNGYATIKKDGAYYLINENFEIVSEAFAENYEGMSTMETDYYMFSQLDGKAVFHAKDADGMYHIVTID